MSGTILPVCRALLLGNIQSTIQRRHKGQREHNEIEIIEIARKEKFSLNKSLCMKRSIK